MKKVIAIFSILFSLESFSAINPAKDIQELVENQVSSMLDINYDQFISYGTKDFKAITKEMFEGVSKQISSHLKNGYKLTYLTSLRTQGFIKHLWKISFTDKGDDILMSMVLNKNKEIAGFWVR